MPQLKTALTTMLGIEHPIIQGGMQYVGYAEMASAVSNAGGLGILTGLTQPTPEDLRKEIRKCRTMTDKPFGVNLTILPSLIKAPYDDYMNVIAEEKVAMVEIAGGNPKKYIPMLRENGVKVLHKSATIRHALKAQDAGVDLCEIVGYGGSIAGGQPGDEVGVWVILAKACETLKVPVVCAGANGTGRQLAAALSMGASGITMATRFLCTQEAPVKMSIKEVMASDEVDERSTTVVMKGLRNSTRVFKNSVTMKMNEIEAEGLAKGNLDFGAMAPYANGQRTKNMWQQSGDTEDSMWSAGQSLGLIHDIPTCKVLVDRIVKEAIEQLTIGQSYVVQSKM